jgi:ectoine hydroxylase-related dioxygenase (phytanoyl-CoA dioxygenase family)
MTKSFSLDSDYKQFFDDNGFCVIDGVDSSKIDSILNSLVSILHLPKEQIGRQAINHALSNPDWNGRSKRMWDSPSLLSFYSSDFILQILRGLGLSCPIWSTRPEVRLDFPGAEAFSQPWHQDFMYSQTSLNSVTFWLPLHDVTISDGALQVIPASHRAGLYPFDVLTNPRRFSIPTHTLTGNNINVEMKKGQLLVFSQLLVHRSGINSSSDVRVSVQGRFADMDCAFFKEGNFSSTDPNNIQILRKV